jgi:hypothetical protein
MTAQPALYHLLYVPQEEVIANNGRMSRKTLKKVPCEHAQKKVPCEHAQKRFHVNTHKKKVPCEHASINMLFCPPHVDSCGSDRPRRLPAPLEASASGPAAPRAPEASPQAAWRSGEGGGGFHVNRCRHASPPPLHVDSCGSDRPRRLPAPLEASASGPAAPRAPAASPQAAWRSGEGGGGFHVNRWLQ